MEAYAMERPVIGAAIGGIPELVREGETGVLYPSGNAEALAARLKEFDVKSDNDIIAMGKEARNWVEAEFAGVLYRDRIREVYKSLGVQC
jgi:glycosyltransferase involved in cell wall biosynthesis